MCECKIYVACESDKSRNDLRNYIAINIDKQFRLIFFIDDEHVAYRVESISKGRGGNRWI